MTTKVNIDEKEGMQIAQRLGVLEEGLPNIRLFNGKSTVGTSILQGNYIANSTAVLVISG